MLRARRNIRRERFEDKRPRWNDPNLAPPFGNVTTVVLGPADDPRSPTFHAENPDELCRKVHRWCFSCQSPHMPTYRRDPLYNANRGERVEGLQLFTVSERKRFRIARRAGA